MTKRRMRYNIIVVKYNEDNMKKYFKFGKYIIAVNMIGTDFQDRNNGLI